MAGVWSKLTHERRDELLRRKEAGEDITRLAVEAGMNVFTLNRRLQEWRKSRKDVNEYQPKYPVAVQANELTFPTKRPLPTNVELFDLLRKGPVSLGELSRRYDRSEETILQLIDRMEAAGYVIERSQHAVSVNTCEHPHVDYAPARTLADEVGHEILFAVASDAHVGSTHAQPSARARFIQIAYEGYGVRHVFDPGDLTTGVNGYRGQELDIIPALRPASRKDYTRATEGQIWLADAYTPRLPGLRYFELGGNHDYWHVVHSGIDAVARFCRQRDDAVYLGYDVADIPLTDRVSVRLLHPSGGSPYAISYRLQKNLEQLAFAELTRAIEENDNPKVRFLLAGHLHIEVKFHRGPMVAAHVGCFEGQTNYLKRKGLFPTIGGAIFRVHVMDNGLVRRCEYTFIPFTEVAEDWRNWPLPPDAQALQEPQPVETLFQLREMGD